MCRECAAVSFARTSTLRSSCRMCSNVTTPSPPTPSNPNNEEGAVFVFLSTPEENKAYCESTYLYEGPEEPPRVQALIDLMHKVGGVKWSAETIADIANLDKHGDLFGGKHGGELVAWMDGLVKGEKSTMIDTFRLHHPKAQGRFTCWNQVRRETSNK